MFKPSKKTAQCSRNKEMMHPVLENQSGVLDEQGPEPGLRAGHVVGGVQLQL